MNLWEVDYSATAEDAPGEILTRTRQVQWVATKGTSLDDVRSVLAEELGRTLSAVSIMLYSAKFIGEVFTEK